MSKSGRVSKAARPKPKSAPEVPVRALSPLLPVASMDATIDFYRTVLGFAPVMQSEAYAILRRGPASLHLHKAAPGVLKKTRGQLAIYLEVENIETLWEHVAQFRKTWQIRDLFDREYGMREFHVIDPDGCLIFVGQQIAK